MTERISIPLDPPVTIGTKRYDKVVVRAPSYGEFMDFGEPLEGQSSEGVRVTVEHLDRLKAYCEACTTTGDDAIAEPAVLAAGGFELARKVQRAVLGFLYPPVAGGTTSPTT